MRRKYTGWILLVIMAILFLCISASAAETVTLKEYIDLKISYEKQLREAEDRRYKEVQEEREKGNIRVDEERNKAIEIKEEAGKIALSLASSDLRTAIDDLKLTIKPLVEYVNSQQGRSTGIGEWYGYIIAALTVVLGYMIFVREKKVP